MLEVDNLHKVFRQNFTERHILKGLSFHVEKGSILGIVGESGCGKTTTALCISGLLPYENGKICLDGRYLEEMKPKQRNIWLRQNIQYIFQYPGGSLHPKKRIKNIFLESVNSIQKLTHKRLDYNSIDIMEKVGLTQADLDKYPSDFCGGEKQRITIARSLLVKPSLLIADEPISSSDVTTQAKILNLLKQLNQDGLSLIFITHDLAAAHYLCDWIIVMKDGKIVEQNYCNNIINNPQSSYTNELITSSHFKTRMIHNEN